MTPEQTPPQTKTSAPAADQPVAANYRYWQKHGGEWGAEYDQRKRRQIRLHLQEIMIADYLSHHAPAKVLEFGCGVGRHLSYLSKIPDLDVSGYDQSPTMVAQCERWTSRAWIDEHVAVGPPTGRLPYDDDAFDIVFTAEVLIHVRPEDLDGILSELIRVCRGHIFHIENSAHYQVNPNAHDGCWKHDLEAAYARLGHNCELLPAGYESQNPWRVVLGEPPRYEWSPVVLSLYRALDDNLGPLTADYEALQQEAARRADRIEALEVRNAELEAEYQRLSALENELPKIQEAHREELRKSQEEHAEELRKIQEEQLATLRHSQDLEWQRSELQAALDRQINVFHEHMAELDQKRWLERERAGQLLSERDKFIEQATRLLER
ncbi:MAG: methyltransferase domain-containing protein [Phycisphaerae bacterium]|nr:methyltransferase domain-containing protein [Phycisphaerae bacterium]